MDLADTERNRAAVHEAGHALIAVWRGLDVAVIKLHRLDGEGGMRLREEPSVLDRVWVLYGGPFAEKVVFRRLTSAAVPPEYDELLLAHKLCRQIGIDNTIGIMDQVDAYLREHQVRLELIATRLLETNIVQGADLDRLLQRATVTDRASPTHPTRPSARRIAIRLRIALQRLSMTTIRLRMERPE